jgi:DNA polymerase III epsilon subunit-like protein
MNDVPKIARYIFLDIETTGLDVGVDEIIEIAWVPDEGTPYSAFVEHQRIPNEWVLKKTDYTTRILGAKREWKPAVLVLKELSQACKNLCVDRNFVRQADVYLVGANPAFDDRFLRAAYRIFDAEPPYHYHLIDVEAMAMQEFGWPAPRRIKDLRATLGIEGENPAPHTALGDAMEAKVIFEALRARKVVPA